MRKIKTIAFTLLVICFLSVLCVMAAKPSISDFKQFANDISGEKQKVIFRKVHNGLFSAVYEKSVYKLDPYKKWQWVSSERFKGYMLNFHKQ